VALPGIRHASYRESRPATAAVAAMLAVHRLMGTWSRRVDAFIALSRFARARFLEGGLPPARVHVRPNFVDPDPGVGDGNGGFFLYVGRLAGEKGVQTLLEAWRLFARGRAAEEAPNDPARRLVVVGDGPLAPLVRDAVEALPGVTWEGRLSRPQVLEKMGQARALVFPSLCYENSPGVVLEAFARGLPVLGSRQGSTAELAREGVAGRLFPPGDAPALAELLAWAEQSPSDLEVLHRGARASYEAAHSPRVGASRLLEIYDRARAVRVERRRSRVAGPQPHASRHRRAAENR
jgi:glycosyltransferase involved in cell wall biosynthesis